MQHTSFVASFVMTLSQRGPSAATGLLVERSMATGDWRLAKAPLAKTIVSTSRVAVQKVKRICL